jgi:hypothetical protein
MQGDCYALHAATADPAMRSYADEWAEHEWAMNGDVVAENAHRAPILRCGAEVFLEIAKSRYTPRQ